MKTTTKRIASLTIIIEQDKYDTLRVYSYSVKIVDISVIGGYVQSEYNECYYSQTTRIHQGIAFAMAHKFAETLTHNDFVDTVKRCNSLKQLKHYFGYIPARNYK